VRLFLQGQVDRTRSRELTEQMLVAGLPVHFGLGGKRRRLSE
jgi:hypothetical protein